MAHIFISAAHKSSGKTTISIGLCAALTARGYRVHPFKKGPDYIDPMWLGRAAGNPCYNLDFHTMEAGEITSLFKHTEGNRDVSIIEGNKGLYDGLDLEGSNSNAALAKLLGAPVILVLDTRGMTRGIAPLILGYQNFDPEINIAGVILNQLGGSRHESKLRAVIEHYTDVPVIGAVHREQASAIDERHLGLIPSNEHQKTDGHIRHLGQRISEQVELEKIMEIAAGAQVPASNKVSLPPQAPAIDLPKTRIGIARDEAFGFYYPGDLEALEQAGASLLPFDTLNDDQLPDVDALFLGGGFPETRLQGLEDNRALRTQIRDAIRAGMPTYAECGGLMYLSRSIQWKDQRKEMVGVIPGDIIMHERPQGRGYVYLEETADHPWASGDKEQSSGKIPGHEFHYSSLENLPADSRFAYRVVRGAGITGTQDGLVLHNMTACYSHLRDTDKYHWTNRFIDFVRACMADKEQSAESGT